MTEIKAKKFQEYGSVAGWEGYPYHLPDKPLPMGKISYDEFLEWADEDTHAEWVEGEIIMASPASYKHQDIKGFLESVLRPFTAAFDLGIVLSAGFQMKLPESQPGREPDLLFVAKTHQARIRPTFLNGPADLAVEIVSDESQERDRVTKFAEYQAGGVPEYWLLDPTSQQAEFYRLDEQGVYQSISPDVEGKYHSQAIAGFWLKVDWLWRNPLPTVEAVLKRVGGAAYEEHLARQSQNNEL